MIGEITFKGMDGDIDSQYFDENGDHIYYDRSLIEKKLFRQNFPHIKDVRSISRLFNHKDISRYKVTKTENNT